MDYFSSGEIAGRDRKVWCRRSGSRTHTALRDQRIESTPPIYKQMLIKDLDSYNCET